MSENKEYVSRCDELGNIHISEEVLAGIAAAAALEVDGVSSLAANLGSDIAELLGKKNLAKGVRVKTRRTRWRWSCPCSSSMDTPSPRWARPSRMA